MLYSQSTHELTTNDGAIIASGAEIVARLNGPDKRGKWYVMPLAAPGAAAFPLSRYGERQTSLPANGHRYFLHCLTPLVRDYIAAHREDLEVVA